MGGSNDLLACSYKLVSLFNLNVWSCRLNYNTVTFLWITFTWFVSELRRSTHFILWLTKKERTWKFSRIWGSRSGDYEEFYVLGYDAVQSVESQLTFRRNIFPSSSGLESKPSKKTFMKQAESNATCTSETSVDFQRTILRYIPEDRTLHKKNLLTPIPERRIESKV
jgi:hypothetical protein